MADLPKAFSPNLLVGYESSDDAAVYRVSDELAMIQTVDFFPPMVDDPYSFGQIAAANALSDVYAMGGSPCMAMNLLTFPNCLPLEAVQGILQGGAEKVLEAGAVIAGGHSIEDVEPKYGLCVTGLINPKDVLTNDGVQVGDILILTKPLGTGIMTTAAKAELLTEEENLAMIKLMSTLNKYAGEASRAFHLHGCTDITGFGLLGHAAEMIANKAVTLELWSASVPVLPKALELATMGIIPAGAYRNRDYVGDKVLVEGSLAQSLEDVLYDPQTSGGLLFSVESSEVRSLLASLKNAGVEAGAIGEIKPLGAAKIIIK